MQQSHKMGLLLEVRSSVDTTLLQTILATDGDVTIADDGQSARRTVDINMEATQSLVVDSLGDLLAPATNEIYIYRGIIYPDGTKELIPLGVFTVTNFILDDSGQGYQIRLSMADRVHRIQASPLFDSVSFAGGTTYVAAIQSIISGALPSTIFLFDQVPNVMGTTSYEAGTDRWKIAQDFAASIGCSLYFDIYGRCVLKIIPDYASQAAGWVFQEGTNSTFLYVNKQVSDTDFFNDIVVIGQSPDNTTPVRVEAADTNPGSPTNIASQYGRRVKVIKDSSIKDTSTAAARAQGELQKSLGFGEQVYISAIVFPVFELGDVVTMVRAASKLSANYTIEKISYPLTNDRPMYLTFQKRLERT